MKAAPEESLDELVFICTGLSGTYHVKDLGLVKNADYVIEIVRLTHRILTMQPLRLMNLSWDLCNVTEIAIGLGLPIDFPSQLPHPTVSPFMWVGYYHQMPSNLIIRHSGENF